MLDVTAIEDFLAQRRIAVVGVSGRSSHFGATVVRELRRHGYDVVGVSRSLAEFEGRPCVSRLRDLPTPVDGVVVMVSGDAATGVVEEAADVGIRRVWLFKGLGGPGACSDAAVAAARARGMTVVEGACPLMFLEPVGAVHRVHRWARRRTGSLPAARRAA